jgi:hypothetical protein
VIKGLKAKQAKGIKGTDSFIRPTGECVTPLSLQVGYISAAGAGGAHHPVISELYNSIPKGKRTVAYHAQCGEADLVSLIAKQHNIQTVPQLKNLLKVPPSPH